MPIYVNQETGEEIDLSEHPNDLRSMLEDSNKKLREAEKARVKAEAELSPYRAKEREAKLTESIGALGTPAVRTWLRVQPDVEPTEETVSAFAEEFGFTLPTGDGEDKPKEAKAASTFSFAPTVPDGPPQPKTVTREEYEAWRDSDPGAAIAFRTSGGVIKD